MSRLLWPLVYLALAVFNAHTAIVYIRKGGHDWSASLAVVLVLFFVAQASAKMRGER